MDIMITVGDILQTIVDCILIGAIIATAKSVKAIHAQIKGELDRQRLERYKKSNPYG